MNRLLTVGVAAAALLSASAASAAVTYYDITAGDPTTLGGSATFGEVKVEDISADTLEITVDLAAGYGFQNAGKNQSRDAVAFNIVGGGAVTYDFILPDDGIIGSGFDDTFTGHGPTAGTFGQGWAAGWNYAVKINNKNNPAYLYGSGGELLKFRVTAASGSAVLGSRSLSPTNDGGPYDIAFAFDLSGVPGGFATGPAGAVKRVVVDPCDGPMPPSTCSGTGGGGAVPEPATWAMMIMGFGAAGTMLRRRRSTFA